MVICGTMRSSLKGEQDTYGNMCMVRDRWMNNMCYSEIELEG